MDKLQKVKYRLSGVADAIRAQLGDAFNLESVANRLNSIESSDEITPELAQAQDYTRFVPYVSGFTANLNTSVTLVRNRGVGKGKRYSGKGNDIPVATALYDEVSIKTQAGVIGYRVNMFEMASADAMSLSYLRDKITAARVGAETHLNELAWEGDPDSNLRGLLNQNGVDVTSSTINFKTETLENILAFFNLVISGGKLAGEIRQAVRIDTIVLDALTQQTLASRLIPETKTSFLAWLKEQNVFAIDGINLSWVATSRSNGKGIGGKNRIIAYKRDPSCLEFRVPQELEFIAGQADGFDVEFPGSYIYQGLWLKRVDSMRYADVPTPS